MPACTSNASAAARSTAGRNTWCRRRGPAAPPPLAPRRRPVAPPADAIARRSSSSPAAWWRAHARYRWEALAPGTTWPLYTQLCRRCRRRRNLQAAHPEQRGLRAGTSTSYQCRKEIQEVQVVLEVQERAHGWALCSVHHNSGSSTRTACHRSTHTDWRHKLPHNVSPSPKLLAHSVRQAGGRHDGHRG